MKDKITEITHEVLADNPPKNRLKLASLVYRICKERGIKEITFSIVQAVIKEILDALFKRIDDRLKPDNNSHSTHSTIYS